MRLRIIGTDGQRLAEEIQRYVWGYKHRHGAEVFGALALGPREGDGQESDTSL
jgi:hypothetical protein